MTEFAPYLPGFIAAYAILLVGASSPGPAVAMLLGISTNQGRGPALVTCAGIATGSMTINILTMLGVEARVFSACPDNTPGHAGSYPLSRGQMRGDESSAQGGGAAPSRRNA